MLSKTFSEARLRQLMTPVKLRAWRKKEGLTMREAGEWYGLSPKSAERSWSRYEHGQRRIPVPLIRRILDTQWQRRNARYRNEPDDLAHWKARR